MVCLQGTLPFLSVILSFSWGTINLLLGQMRILMDGQTLFSYCVYSIVSFLHMGNLYLVISGILIMIRILAAATNYVAGRGGDVQP
jgi:hypothetical protein